MNIKFSKALLNTGKSYELTDQFILHHPTIGEVMSINKTPQPDTEYLVYLNIILADPYYNMVMLDDLGKNYLDVTPFEVFCLQWDNCVEDYNKNKALYDSYGIKPIDNIIKALNFFIEGDHNFAKGVFKNKNVCFYDVDDPQFQITNEIFECLHEWVKAINKIDNTARINPADENARRVLIEDMRDEIKKSKKRKNKKKETNFDYLGNLMSACMYCRNGAITPFNIMDCKIYWLIESMSINAHKDNASHLLDGIYHGTISSKSIKSEELEWAK